MKVKELIKFLKTLPKDKEVLLSKDAEGNGYFKATNEWSETETQIVLYPSHELLYIDDDLIEFERKDYIIDRAIKDGYSVQERNGQIYFIGNDSDIDFKTMVEHYEVSQ